MVSEALHRKSFSRSNQAHNNEHMHMHMYTHTHTHRQTGRHIDLGPLSLAADWRQMLIAQKQKTMEKITE